MLVNYGRVIYRIYTLAFYKVKGRERHMHQENTRNSPDVLFARSFNIGCQMFYIFQMF
jgi:hypothetical protein